MKRKSDVTVHRDQTITYWPIYLQNWVYHAKFIETRELAAMNDKERSRVMPILDYWKEVEENEN
jgi:hypothetical protein